MECCECLYLATNGKSLTVRYLHPNSWTLPYGWIGLLGVSPFLTNPAWIGSKTGLFPCTAQSLRIRFVERGSTACIVIHMQSIMVYSRTNLFSTMGVYYTMVELCMIDLCCTRLTAKIHYNIVNMLHLGACDCEFHCMSVFSCYHRQNRTFASE
jgi:hypothetical protein